MSGGRGGTSLRLLAPAEAAIEAANLRAEAETRYGEVDLLVAALREHIDDLRLERDRLLRDVARMRDDLRRERATWLERGMKPSRALIPPAPSPDFAGEGAPKVGGA